MAELYPLLDGWRWVRLGEVCEFEYVAGLPERDRSRGLVPMYGSNDVVEYLRLALTRGPAIILDRKDSIGQIKYSRILREKYQH